MMLYFRLAYFHVLSEVVHSINNVSVNARMLIQFGNKREKGIKQSMKKKIIRIGVAIMSQPTKLKVNPICGLLQIRTTPSRRTGERTRLRNTGHPINSSRKSDAYMRG